MDYDLIIIGAGPAGITAGIYAARLKLNFMVIAKEIGGQVAVSSIVENYTGYQFMTGQELSDKFMDHINEFKFDFKQAEVQSIKKDDKTFTVSTISEFFTSKTVIVATGAHPRSLDIPGEKEFTGKGVTYCATCDAPLYKEKVVTVVGGGNTGLESALQLTNIAKKIYLIHRGDELSGDQILVDKVIKLKNVEILPNTSIKEIVGGSSVEKIKIETKGKEDSLDVQGVFINIGYIPNSDVAKNVLPLNKYGEIEVDYCCLTDSDGIFAAGDCTNVPFKQIVVATGEGCKAALSVNNYLNNN